MSSKQKAFDKLFQPGFKLTTSLPALVRIPWELIQPKIKHPSFLHQLFADIMIGVKAISKLCLHRMVLGVEAGPLHGERGREMYWKEKDG